MLMARRDRAAACGHSAAGLACLPNDADLEPQQPSGEKSLMGKHHFSLSHYAKLANR